jgi:hypothetical protein
LFSKTQYKDGVEILPKAKKEKKVKEVKLKQEVNPSDTITKKKKFFQKKKKDNELNESENKPIQTDPSIPVKDRKKSKKKKQEEQSQSNN